MDKKEQLQRNALQARMIRERAKCLVSEIESLCGSESKTAELAKEAHYALAELSADLQSRLEAEKAGSEVAA